MMSCERNEKISFSSIPAWEEVLRHFFRQTRTVLNESESEQKYGWVTKNKIRYYLTRHEDKSKTKWNKSEQMEMKWKRENELDSFQNAFHSKSIQFLQETIFREAWKTIQVSRLQFSFYLSFPILMLRYTKNVRRKCKSGRRGEQMEYKNVRNRNMW